MRSHRSVSLSSQGPWRAELVLSLLCGQTVPPGLARDAGQGLRLCGHLGPGWPFWGREGLSCTYLEAQQHCLWLPPSPPASSPQLSCPHRAALALACSAQACLDPTQRHQAGSSPPLAPVGRGCKRGGGCESIAQPRGENKAAWGPWLHVCASPPGQGVLSAAVEGPGLCAPQPVLTLPGSPGAELMLPLAPSGVNQAHHLKHLTPVRVFAALKTRWVLFFFFWSATSWLRAAEQALGCGRSARGWAGGCRIPGCA